MAQMAELLEGVHERKRQCLDAQLEFLQFRQVGQDR